MKTKKQLPKWFSKQGWKRASYDDIVWNLKFGHAHEEELYLAYDWACEGEGWSLWHEGVAETFIAGSPQRLHAAAIAYIVGRVWPELGEPGVKDINE